MEFWNNFPPFYVMLGPESRLNFQQSYPHQIILQRAYKKLLEAFSGLQDRKVRLPSCHREAVGDYLGHEAVRIRENSVQVTFDKIIKACDSDCHSALDTNELRHACSFEGRREVWVCHTVSYESYWSCTHGKDRPSLNPSPKPHQTARERRACPSQPRNQRNRIANVLHQRIKVFHTKATDPWMTINVM